MVVNKLSDMKCGRNAGICTVLLYTIDPEILSPNKLIDFRYRVDTPLPTYCILLNKNAKVA